MLPISTRKYSQTLRSFQTYYIHRVSQITTRSFHGSKIESETEDILPPFLSAQENIHSPGNLSKFILQ